MAEANILIPKDLFSCPVCLDLLKDPVTIACGRSFCQVCINGFWDQEDVKGVYSCPQCRKTFTLRPVLRRNNKLTKVVEELKETELQAASPAHCYAGPGDVECDSCIRRKRKAVRFCLVCLASYCEAHLQPHYQSPAFKQHKLVEACAELQEKICSQHKKPIEIYCRTDQSFICYLCVMDKHKGHDTTNAEKAEKQNELKEEQMKSQQRIQEKQKKVQELKQTVDTIKSFPSLFVPPGCEDSPSITVNQHLSFDGVRQALSDLKKRVEENSTVQMILPSEPKSREDFVQYFCYLTLDPNTVHRRLILSEENRVVTHSRTEQRYSYHPERFQSYTQVLCKESVSGRCYWEVEWSSGVSISVSYKEISRKGEANKCLFGYNSQSWSLRCSSSSVCFWHNDIKTDLGIPSSSRIGVYVDHSAGTLSFYSFSDTMRLLHRVHATFTQPLYAGFRLWYNSSVRLCDPK
ncbi:tripartite motif-containing protein 16-like protein [Pangasianodon hypophthalmus]|uniref:tripartite motif-containing protein 16-like protein n=1 Tax=Pangasianodon hypophthalmus TaxID=310915 RepID=UPI000EFEC071|nr:tripartite motif-containing protein 16-like protein [Pangasianodon hypophthalmus]